MTGVLSSTQIEQLLHEQWLARIGCHARDRTYVVPVTYVYDGTAILGQTGNGLKVQMMRENPNVCVEVDHSPRIASWQSVILHGRYEELSAGAASAAVALLTARLTALRTSDGATPPHGAGRFEVGSEDVGQRAEVVYRIAIDDRSGRYENV